MQCEAVLLGREAVDGPVNASTMATLIRSLLASRERISRNVGDIYRDRRRFTLRCRDGVEILPSNKTSSSSSSTSSTSSQSRPKRMEDEGFESDDDTASTKSAASLDDSLSNSSSCCFVDDHVFKFPSSSSVSSRGAATSSSSSVATDSANSSGASDTDDLDTSSAPSPSTGSVSKLVQSLSLYQRGGKDIAAKVIPGPNPSTGEVYPVADVAFCHLDPAFPKVVVWVVKKRRVQRLTSDNPCAGLEAIVFECNNEKALKKLCTSFQEISRRAKLDQYKHPHRRKDGSLFGSTPNLFNPRAFSKDIKPLQTIVKKIDLKPMVKEVKPIEVRPIKAPPKPAPKPAPKPPPKEEDIPMSAKFNLVQRTDGDGVTHIEVSRGNPSASVPVETIPDSAGPSSIISISTPDVGNLLSASAGAKSRLCKEIEGVIRSDFDAGSVRKDIARQRQPAILVMKPGESEELHKIWTPPNAGDEEEEDHRDSKKGPSDPPQRPERRKYVRKKPPAPQPPVQVRPAPSPDPYQKKPLVPYKPEFLTRNQQKIVRGQFIRVSVDPQWVMGSTPYTNAWRMSSPEPVSREHISRRGLDDMFAIQGHTLKQNQHKNHRRSRSSGGCRSKSPPLTRRPMAYRYIDVGTPPPPSSALSSRFFGLSQKLRELGGQASPTHPYATTARRRGSLGEACHLSGVAGGSGNLKSVIKKSKRAGEYVEPKKVTFSAYATVQVVD